MKCTFNYCDREPFIVENVKELETRENKDVTCITRDERRARIPAGWYDYTCDPEPADAALGAPIPSMDSDHVWTDSEPVPDEEPTKEGIPAEVTITEDPATGTATETIVNQDGTDPEVIQEPAFPPAGDAPTAS